MNGYLGYLPTKDEYAYGGYEVELSPIVYGTVTNLLMPPGEYCGVDCEKGYGFM